MVFQQFNLFPHLSVLDNLTLGPIKARGLLKSEATERAMHYLERVRIPEQAKQTARPIVRWSTTTGRHRAIPRHGTPSPVV